MANPTLNTGVARVKFGKMMLWWAANESPFMKLSGGGKGSNKAIYLVPDSKGEAFSTYRVDYTDQFWVEPTPGAATLEDNLGTSGYRVVTGTRISLAAGIPINKSVWTQAFGKPQLVKDHTEMLGRLFAVYHSLYVVSIAGAYTPSAITTATTTATFWDALNPNNSTTLAAFKAIVNLANIGTSSAASSTAYNVFFAGLDENEDPITAPAADTWNDILANPKDHKLSPASFRAFNMYNRGRSIPRLDVDFNGKPTKAYMVFLPPAAIYDLREDDEYRTAVTSGSVSAKEMWNGKPFGGYMCDGVILVEAEHSGYNAAAGSDSGLVRDTPLRSESCQNDGFAAYEGLGFGANSLGQAEFDDFEVVENDRHDFKRKVELGADVCTGLVALQRSDKNGTARRNVTSFCFAASNWG